MIYFKSIRDREEELLRVACRCAALAQPNRPPNAKRIMKEISDFADKVATDAVYESNSPSAPKNGW